MVCEWGMSDESAPDFGKRKNNFPGKFPTPGLKEETVRK
jgi:hypothetical protein